MIETDKAAMEYTATEVSRSRDRTEMLIDTNSYTQTLNWDNPSYYGQQTNNYRYTKKNRLKTKECVKEFKITTL